MWSASGTLLTMPPTPEKACRPLRHLRLIGRGPEGGPVLIRPEHDLLTRVEVPEDDAVAAPLAGHTRRRVRLRKQLSPPDWLWTHEGAPAFLRSPPRPPPGPHVGRPSRSRPPTSA
ncbi:hypothetical protein A6A08_06215 [Nocardiopsis sp. TSRI0078]|nr:hypothetical protein A6A08_06215 [Nocardiopsis sp. TSRI0078]